MSIEGINIDELKSWLRERWRRDNHAKYQQYFEPWFANITDSQIYKKRPVKNTKSSALCMKQDIS